jgi:hypothetical protein
MAEPLTGLTTAKDQSKREGSRSIFSRRTTSEKALFDASEVSKVEYGKKLVSLIEMENKAEKPEINEEVLRDLIESRKSLMESRLYASRSSKGKDRDKINFYERELEETERALSVLSGDRKNQQSLNNLVQTIGAECRIIGEEAEALVADASALGNVGVYGKHTAKRLVNAGNQVLAGLQA